MINYFPMDYCASRCMVDKVKKEQKMHPAKKNILRYFEYKHLPENLQEISKPICKLAHKMVKELPDNAETTAGLRKLLEAKDCFVRASLFDD